VLSTTAVDVLAASIDVSGDELDRLADSLEPAELRRARRLSGPARQQFIATRAILRALLAERLSVAAAAVPLRASEDGKLFVPGDVMFNVSHSQDLAAFAFTRNRRVGVDVELLRPVSRLPGVVELALAPWEAAELREGGARAHAARPARHARRRAGAARRHDEIPVVHGGLGAAAGPRPRATPCRRSRLVGAALA